MTGELPPLPTPPREPRAGADVRPGVEPRPGAEPHAGTGPHAEPLLEVAGLHIAFGRTEVVRGISFTVAAGECLALIGSSGSGKSVTARALIGLAGDGARVTADRLLLSGRSLQTTGRRAARDEHGRLLRGGVIGFLLQDALVSLDPARTIGAELDSTIRLHFPALSAAARRERALDLLRRVGLPEPEARLHQRASALSGGQRQRALIAIGLAGEPRLLIADEPTTALDATARVELLELLRSLADSGLGILLISHDLTSVRRLADRIVVMHEGEIVETATADRVLDAPRSPTARALVAAMPRPPLTRAPVTGPIMLTASGLAKERRRPDGTAFAALADASLDLRAGEILGVVGASGSGKSTLARLLLALEGPDHGAVTLDGAPWSPLAERARRSRRGRIALVAQDALSGFDPRLRVGAILADALSRGRYRRPGPLRARIDALLAEVGLAPDLTDALPRHLSGGQRQRVAIARALAANPRILVADEAVSALDATIRRQVVDLLARLRDERSLACVFISHDLDVVAELSDRIAVIDAGRIVETGPSVTVITDPQHPATRRLLGLVSGQVRGT